MKVQVTIKRPGQAGTETFTGTILGETTTHFLVGWDSNEKGEWFARNSRNVNCEVKP